MARLRRYQDDQGNATGDLVYFILCQKTMAVKIGVSWNPERRLTQLQTACPGELCLVGTVPGGAAKEAELHARFADRRIKGEWFRLTTDDIQVVLVETFADLEVEEEEREELFAVRPRRQHDVNRYHEIVTAINWRTSQNFLMEPEWVEELAELLPRILAFATPVDNCEQDQDTSDAGGN